MKRLWGRRRDLLGLSVLALANLAIFWNLVFHEAGQLTWGNYLTPFSLRQIQPGTFFYNPYFLNGTITFLPATNLLYQLTESYPLIFLATIAGLRDAIIAYAILASIFVTWAFYFLARTWGVGPMAATAAGLFFALNDFQIYLIGSGNFLQFVSEAFLLLSLGLLALWVRAGQRPFWLIAVAMGFLALTFGEIQLTLLGVALYLSCGVMLTFHRCKYRPRSAARPLARFLTISLALAPLVAYAVLPLLAGSYAYGPGSPTAVTLEQFSARSQSFLQMIELVPAVPISHQAAAFAAANSGSLQFYQDASTALIFILLASVVFVRDLRLLWMDVLIFVAAALGAGPTGPLGGLSSYLYIHFAPYASLNAPYFWQWVPISILLGLMLGIVCDRLVQESRPWLKRVASLKKRAPSGPALERGAVPVGALVATGALAIVGLLLAIAILTPLAADAPYGPWTGPTVAGIHGTTLPSDYSQLDQEISRIGGSSGTGVAFFPPDVFVWPNATPENEFNNPFTQWPTQRSAGLPFYGAPALNSNYYFYWVYYLFYKNQTQNLAQLMGLEGISIFVVLYNWHSASYYPYFMSWAAKVNASKEMQYQRGISEVYSSESFAIFTSQYLTPGAAYFRSATMVAGTAATVNEMTYAGWNLTTEAILLPGDGPGASTGEDLDGVDSLVLGSQQGLYFPSLTAGGGYCVNPLQYADTSLATSDAWSTSQRAFSSVVNVSQPLPYAYASGFANLSVPLPGGSPPGSLLWIELLRDTKSGIIQFSLGTAPPFAINTSQAPSPALGAEYDGFSWVNVSSLPTTGGGTLEIRSDGGQNGIAEVCVATPGQLAAGELSLFNQARTGGVALSLVEEANSIADTSANVGRYQTNSTTIGDASIPEGRYVKLLPTATGAATMQVLVPSDDQTGNLYVLVSSNSQGDLTISSGNVTSTLTFVRSSPTVGDSSWDWYPATVPSGTGMVPVMLSTPPNASTKIDLALVAYIPDALLSPAGLSTVAELHSQARGVGSGPLPGLTTVPVVAGSVMTTGIPLDPTLSGFMLESGACAPGNVLVRTNYFSNFRTSGSATSVYSALGSTNTVLVKTGGCSAGVYAESWTYFVVGSGISIATISALLVVPVIPRAVRAAGSRIRSRVPATTLAGTSVMPATGVVAVRSSTIGRRALVDEIAILGQGIRRVSAALPAGSPASLGASQGLQEVRSLLAEGRVQEAHARMVTVAENLVRAARTRP